MADLAKLLNSAAIRGVAVAVAGAIAVTLGNVVGSLRDNGDADYVTLVVVVTGALIVAQHLVMTKRVPHLVVSLVTAVAAPVMLFGQLEIGTASLALILAVAFAVACALFDDLPIGIHAFAPWSLIFALNDVDAISGDVIGSLGAAGVALTGAAVLAHRVDTATATAAPMRAEVATTSDGPATPAAVAPNEIDFQRSPKAPAPTPDDELEAAFAGLHDGDKPTVAVPPTPAPTPDAPVAGSTTGPDDPTRRLPAPRGHDAEDSFHLVLGDPSRADGVPGELSIMPYPYTPGTEADQFTAGNWVVQARSSRGSSHVHGGDHRQDSYALAMSENGRFAIAVVSDGLGSARRSHFGSYWATRRASAHLARELKADTDVSALLREIPAIVASDMTGLASHLIAAEPADIAATLVMCVVPVDGPAPLWLARVGDSDAMVLTENGAWASGFGGGDASAIETGTTDVLPHHPDRVEVRTIDGSKVRALLVATDGVSRVIENSPEIVGAEFAARLAEPVDPIEFQRVVDFRRRGAHDDRTAIAMWHRPSGAS